MREIVAACAFSAVLTPAPAPQRDLPDLSGRWVLVDASKAGVTEPDTLEIRAPDQLLITQTPLAITIEHPSRPGTHPAPGRFTFTAGGTVSGDGLETRSATFWFGHQLILSNSSTETDSAGVTRTVAYGSIWSLDPVGRLVIEFGEHRTGTRPNVATRVYIRRPQ